ncbi:MAG: DoxX family protein [Rhodospirillales bacterium]
MKALIDLLIIAPARLSAVFADLPPLAARLTVGWVFMMTGWGKLNNLPKITEFFTELGIPAPQILTPLVSGMEFVGGLLLILGLFTRLAATPLIAVMVVAIITAKWADIDSYTTLAGIEEVTYMVVFGYLAVLGPGRISLDGVLTAWRRSVNPSAPFAPRV